MAKSNKRPFSSFLENPDTSKAVQEALHAPAQLPTTEPTPEPPAPQPVAEVAPQEEPVRLKPGPKPKLDKEEYTVITIKTSLHRYLKIAAAQNNVEIRELATEAIAADPRVQEIIEKFS